MRIGVTGASGLLGRAAVKHAVSRGHAVVALDRVLTPGADPFPAIEQRAADVRSREAMAAALEGLDAVVHTASRIDLHLGEPSMLHDVNVTGVKNVIAACRANSVPRLVYMSSAEVISAATPQRGVSEEQPYADPHLTYYGVTKQAGEELVLAAADRVLGTCAMRTFGIFGEGDNTMVPMYLSKLVLGTRAFVGNLEGQSDVIHATNLAHALVLAAEQLEPETDWSGSVFHVTDHAPVNVQKFLAELTAPLGLRTISRPPIPRVLAQAIATAGELLYKQTQAERFARPSLTSHNLHLGLGDYWLDSTKVRTTLGFEPPVTRADAIARTQAWLTSEYSPHRGSG